MTYVDDSEYKWCPFVRDISGHQVGNVESESMDGRNPMWSRCISSRCMMWRYHTEGKEDEPLDLDGYCGLAGKPAGAA